LTHCHSATDVGDREILETYLNSESKNTSEIDIFPHGTKSLLTSVIKELVQTTEVSHAPHYDVSVNDAPPT